MDRDLLDLTTKAEPIITSDGIGDPNSAMNPDLWQDLFGLPVDYHPWIGWNVPGPANLLGEGISIAMTCATVKARDIGKSEMKLWKINARGGWDPVLPRDHWFAKMLNRRPNDYQTWGEFWRMLVMHRDLTQNAYVIKRRNRMGQTVEMFPWMPARCRMRVSFEGNIFYEVAAANEFEQAVLGGSYMLLPATEVVHIRGRMWDGFEGLSNERVGNPIFALTDAIQKYQTNLFGSDGRQPMVYEMKETFGIGDEAIAAFNRLKAQLREATRRMNALGEAIVLEGGLTAKPIAANPKDALAPEAYKAMVQRICSLMDMPPHKIYFLDPVKYNNQSAMDSTYAHSVLQPVCEDIEEHFRLEVMLEEDWDDYYPEFDRLALLAGDPTTLMTVMKDAAQLAALTINELRERLPLALGPIEGGDVRMVPVNVRLVDETGKEVMAAPTQPKPNAPNDQQTQQSANQNRSSTLQVVK